MDNLSVFLSDNFRWLIGFHMLSFVIGFGGALISDIYFIRFIKDFRISDEEHKILKGFSQIVWIGVAMILTSGILLFLSDPAGYLSAPKFLLKMLIVAIIVLNGVFLNFVITPRLTSIEFFDKAGEGYQPRHMRRLAFALGSVSSASWFSAFILGVLRFSPATFEIMLGTYLVVLLGAMFSSQILEHLISKKGFKFPF